MSIDVTHRLAHALVTAGDGATPRAWVYVLHGILGSGANWRTIARRFVQARPEWGAVLVDLRMHGGSRGLSAPHTVAAAAQDLVALEPHVPGPVRGLLAHSFGGKVALAYAGEHGARVGLERLWLVDSSPGVRTDRRGSESTVRVVEMLESLPETFASRHAFVDAVLAEGHELPIAQWLAMNVERDGDMFRFGLDMSAIRALLEDYFTRDLWSVLEHPPADCRIVVINGARSNVWREEDVQRLGALPGSSNVELHVVAKAGHWVHAEAPEELLAILRDSA